MQLHPASDHRADLFRASGLAIAASDNLIVARAFAGRSDHRAAQYEGEARCALEVALALLTGVNDGDPEPSGLASAMQVAA